MAVRTTIVQPKSAPVVMKEEQVVSRPSRHTLNANQITQLKKVLEMSGADSFSQIQALAKIRLIVEV